MDSFLTYVPLISVAILAGLFVMALANFSTVRKNMRTNAMKEFEMSSRYILA